jgi:hypothetical protein
VGLTSGAFDQLQHAGYVALAFGTPQSARPGRYLDLDLVAMAMNMGLTPYVGRESATAIVGGFFHQWASAVGHAEAYPDHEFFMAVAGVGWDGEKRSPKLLLVTNGTLEELIRDFRDRKDLVGFFTVNISDIIRRLRANAKKAGIDLSSPFFFPPDDPRFEEILAQVKRELQARVARIRRDQKKLAVARARGRRQDIGALPRVKNNAYPFNMQAAA